MPTDYSETLQTIKGELNKANVDHQVAEKQYEAVMVTIRDKYGFTTLEEVYDEIKALHGAIPETENHRNAMLAEAQSILQKVGMEDSNGTTKEGRVQKRQPHTTANTMARKGRVRGRVPATNTKRQIR